jgi:fibronectin type 3 domain-containing protein
MKLWIQIVSFTVSLLILSGCVAKVTPKKEAVIDDTLPLVELTKNGTISDMNSIALEWSSFDDYRVKGVYIYRTIDLKDKKSKNDYYDTVNNRFSTHYLDNDVKPNSKYNYYFKTFSEDAESRKSAVTTIESLPLMNSTTWLYCAQNMPRSAKVIWRPHTNQKVKEYIVQRRTLEAQHWTNVATVEGRLNAEYIDENLKDNFTYIYRVRAITFDDIVSNPSVEVRTITKALPAEVVNIQATKNMPRKIELRWQKTSIEDFSHYNIYRADRVNGSYKLIAKRSKNFYFDVIEKDAKQYFYRVSAVDKDALESTHDRYSIQGVTLNKPQIPSLVEAVLIDNKIKIMWRNSDSRAVSYIVQKRHNKNIFESSIEDFENIKALTFLDSEIKAGESYIYKVFSVDKNGVKSEPSIEVKIKVEKTKEQEMQQHNRQDSTVENQNFKQNEEIIEDVVVPVEDF